MTREHDRNPNRWTAGIQRDRLIHHQRQHQRCKKSDHRQQLAHRDRPIRNRRRCQKLQRPALAFLCIQTHRQHRQNEQRQRTQNLQEKLQKLIRHIHRRHRNTRLLTHQISLRRLLNNPLRTQQQRHKEKTRQQPKHPRHQISQRRHKIALQLTTIDGGNIRKNNLNRPEHVSLHLSLHLKTPVTTYSNLKFCPPKFCISVFKATKKLFSKSPCGGGVGEAPVPHIRGVWGVAPQCLGFSPFLPTTPKPRLLLCMRLRLL